MALLDQLIKILEIIIWPLTLLIILGWFKKELKGFFKNLKKIEAGTDGVVFESFERQMSKTRDLFPQTIVTKSTVSIDPTSLKFTRDATLSPEVQLKVWHDIFASDIINQSNSSKSNAQQVLDEMKSSGLIRFNEYQQKSNLLKLTGMKSTSITETSLLEIQDYLNKVS